MSATLKQIKAARKKLRTVSNTWLLNELVQSVCKCGDPACGQGKRHQLARVEAMRRLGGYQVEVGEDAAV